MTKADYAEMRFSEALTEADDFDLLVMGRTQGKGCYCFVNGLLSSQVAKYAKNYRYIRGGQRGGAGAPEPGHPAQGGRHPPGQRLLRRGVQAAGRLAEMVRELDLGPKEVGLIVNRAPGGRLSDGVREEIDRYGLKLMGVVPHDDTVYEYDAEGRPSVTVPENSPVKQAVRAIFDQLAPVM